MKSRWALAVAAVATLAVFGAAQLTYAIPPFAEVFAATYGSNADIKKGIETEKCNVCHMGTKKKDKNAYGNALHDSGLEKVMGDAYKTDKEGTTKKIVEALKKTEEKKNAAGKTFGELLKAGKLPGA